MKFRVGDKVRMINNAPHELLPDCYPKEDVVGTITKDLGVKVYMVRWPKSSGVAPDYEWAVNYNEIVGVKE